MSDAKIDRDNDDMTLERVIYKSEIDYKIEDAINNKIIIVYGQPHTKKCPNCDIIKNLLRANNINFKSINIMTPESATELAVRGCFPKFTPVIQIGQNVYYRELWMIHGKELNINRIKWIIDPDKKNWIDVDGTSSTCKDGVCEI